MVRPRRCAILAEYRDRLDEPDGQRPASQALARRSRRSVLGVPRDRVRVRVLGQIDGADAARRRPVPDRPRLRRPYDPIQPPRSGLYPRAYNLIQLHDDDRELAIDHLPEMLEGQVAVIGSGVLASDGSPRDRRRPVHQPALSSRPGQLHAVPGRRASELPRQEHDSPCPGRRQSAPRGADRSGRNHHPATRFARYLPVRGINDLQGCSSPAPWIT